MIIYFSGTGNSRFAAEFLAKQLGDELLDAGQRIKSGEQDELHSERPWVIAAPTYAWRMANVMTNYLRSAKLRGSRDAYFVLTCGSEIGNAGKYLAAFCEEIGLHYCGVLQVVMPENYIAMFNAPDEEEARSIVAKAKPILKQGGELIQAGKPFPAPKVGLVDRLKSGPVNEGFYKHYVKADDFYATEACIGCGLCMSRCPLNNIRLLDSKPQWGKACTHCMACICGCPAEAIEYGRKSKGKPRYQCPKDDQA